MLTIINTGGREQRLAERGNVVAGKCSKDVYIDVLQYVDAATLADISLRVCLLLWTMQVIYLSVYAYCYGRCKTNKIYSANKE